MAVKLHSWSLTPEEAARIQTELRTRLVLTWDKRPVTTVGGVDVSIKTESTRWAHKVAGGEKFLVEEPDQPRLF